MHQVPFDELKRFVSHSLAQQLGPVAEMLCVAVDRTHTIEELEPVLAECRAVLHEFVGATRTAAFDARIQSLLTGERVDLAA